MNVFITFSTWIFQRDKLGRRHSTKLTIPPSSEPNLPDQWQRSRSSAIANDVSSAVRIEYAKPAAILRWFLVCLLAGLSFRPAMEAILVLNFCAPVAACCGEKLFVENQLPQPIASWHCTPYMSVDVMYHACIFRWHKLTYSLLTAAT